MKPFLKNKLVKFRLKRASVALSISVNSIQYTLPRILHLMYNKSKQALTPKVYSQLQCDIRKRNQNVTLLRQTAALQSTCVHRSVKLCCDFLVLLLFENFCGIPCRLIILPVFFFTSSLSQISRKTQIRIT